MRAKKFNVIDLFCGVGGLSLGAARAGLHVALGVENDAHALAAHTLNFPRAAHISSDVGLATAKGLLRESAIARDDLFGVIGGPPCQGFSSMGHRRFDDPRNQLFVKFFSLVHDLQPAFFLAENVPGVMSAENTPLREQALSLVRDDYEILPAVKVVANDFGAPTNRTRYLFVGYKSHQFDAIAPSDITIRADEVRVREALAGLPARVPSSWNTEAKSWHRISYESSVSRFMAAVRSTIPDGVGDPRSLKLLKDLGLVSGFLGTRHESEVKLRFAKLGPGEVDRVSKARRLDPDGFCPTLRAGTAADRGSYQAVRPIHPSANRVITPREAARLQGFPDWFQFAPTKWHSFRQIGNSVCPPVAEAVFRAILAKRRK